MGAEYNRIRTESISSTGLGLQSDLLTVLGAKTVSAFESIVETRYASLFSELSYSLHNRYFLTGSFRRDGSSRFGINARYGNFYAFSGAWQVSDEAFLKGSNVLTNLKLRLSHGITGNSNPVADYAAYGLYSFVSTPASQYLGQLGAIPSQIPNADLQWERQQTTNLGVDLSLWKRLNVTLELYDKRNFNLLQSVPLPTTSGFSSIARNIGSISNKGIELSLNSRNTTGKLRWETDFNIAFNRNQILALTNNNADIYRNSYVGTILRVGEAVGSYYMPKYAGVDPQTGNPLWEILQKDGNGSVTGVTATSTIGLATLQVLGSPQPKWTGGLTNTLTYGNLV
nr:TonB-dependent receptor [Siphonobacter sp. BAB-5405]